MSVKDWIDAGFHLLQPGGSLTMIHRADALDRIVQALGRRFGGVELIPLWPHAGEAAKRIIVRARKDRKTPATVHAGIVLHDAKGEYTQEADRILRGGEAIP
jgi:tRNA1(Val) A37 N6-methylase TrmN6